MAGIPGIQYPTFTTVTDPQLRDAVRNIYDNLFYLRRAVTEPRNLNPTELHTFEQRLISQVITSVTNNIVNNNTFNGTIITGTHFLRITAYGAAAQSIGAAFFETDRNALYIITDGPKKWQFAAGAMLGLVANQPTDLGIYDASFLFFGTDDTTLYIWDGSSWIAISGGGGTTDGYWSPLTNGMPDNPELVFDSLGECVVVFTPAP